jgi:hypothetical protein
MASRIEVQTTSKPNDAVYAVPIAGAIAAIGDAISDAPRYTAIAKEEGGRTAKGQGGTEEEAQRNALANLQKKK